MASCALLEVPIAGGHHLTIRPCSITGGCIRLAASTLKHLRVGLDGESGLRTPRPRPRCGDLEFGEGPARRKIQGPKIWPTKGQVAHHFWRLDNTDDLPRGRDDPDTAGANAPHPPR